MHTYLFYGMSDDICAIESRTGASSVVEHSVDRDGSKTIQVHGPGETQMRVTWRYGDTGVWTVTPSMVDEDTPMPSGISLVTTAFDDPGYSMLLTLESPAVLTFVDPNANPTSDPLAGVPFPPADKQKEWPRPGSF